MGNPPRNQGLHKWSSLGKMNEEILNANKQIHCGADPCDPAPSRSPRRCLACRPAHHFDSMPGLLTAIAAPAFARLTAAMTAARDAARPDPFARQDGICQGYLIFARTQAGRFDRMFSAPVVNRADALLQPHAQAVSDILRAACQPFVTPDHDMETGRLVHGPRRCPLARHHPAPRQPPLRPVPRFFPPSAQSGAMTRLPLPATWVSHPTRSAGVAQG
jgi:hypothetical protein